MSRHPSQYESYIEKHYLQMRSTPNVKSLAGYYKVTVMVMVAVMAMVMVMVNH